MSGISAGEDRARTVTQTCPTTAPVSFHEHSKCLFQSLEDAVHDAYQTYFLHLPLMKRRQKYEKFIEENSSTVVLIFVSRSVLFRL